MQIAKEKFTEFGKNELISGNGVGGSVWIRGQRSEVRGQRSEVRGQRSEVRGQWSVVKILAL
jgi:hypothetical protein